MLPHLHPLSCIHFYLVFGHLCTQITATISLSWPQDFFKFTISLCHVCVVLRYSKKKLYCSCNTLDSGYSVRSSQALTLTSLSDIFTLGSHCFTELCMGKGSREHRSLLSNSPKLFKIRIVFPHFWGSTWRGRHKFTYSRTQLKPKLSLTSRWLPTPQSKESLAREVVLSSQPNLAFTVTALVLILHPQPFPGL